MNKTLGQRTGEEAVMTGFCHAFRRGVDLEGTGQLPDIVGGFGGKHLIPMGLDLGRILAEAFGKATGYSGGRMGPGSAIHSRDHGVFPHLGLIGVDPAHGVGFGFAARWNGAGQVVGAITTDGGSNTGRFHESLNLAALHRLPVVFAVVNNWYATNMSVERSVATGSIAGRSSGYGIPCVVVDGQDVLACYAASREAVDRARRGDGPTLLEFQTYRYDGDAASGGLDPRPPDEYAAWRERDPLPRFRAWLLRDGGFSGADLERIESECRTELERAVDFAESSPAPEPRMVDPDLYAPVPDLAYAPDRAPAARTLTFARALAEGLGQAMRRDRRVYLMGLNVGRFGSVDGHTEGLWQEFGEERLIDMPIVQATYTAAATATALAGYRPVVIAGSPAIAMAAADELFNVIPNARFASGGRAPVPMVVRIGLTGPGGGRFGNGQTFGPVQSAALHALYTHLPGIYVVAPSDPYDAKGLLLTAIALDDPVYFIEHRGLMRDSGPVPEEEYHLPFGKAVVRRAGSAATVVAISWMVPRTLAAAELLAEEGIDVEVIDPRTLVPLDIDTIVASTSRTGRLITVDQGFHRLNVGAEIIAAAHERLGGELRASRRISAPDSPVPASAFLSGASYPTPERIARSIREVVEAGRAS
jgi:2-oxoisovalerate dehydrogenase E1 component